MIIRTPQRERFVIIAKEAMEDTRLSWKARGLLAYLLTKPDNWKVHTNHLVSQGPDGRDGVKAILRELESFGYITRSTHRNAGRFDGTDVQVHEIAVTADGKSVHGATADGLTGDGSTGDGESAPSEYVREVNTEVNEDVDDADVGVASNGKRAISADLVILSLCAFLAKRIGEYRGEPDAEPVVTKRWTTDMRLLVERGPLGRATPSRVEPDRVDRVITMIFNDLADPGADGFCWAAQVQSPNALRKHWDKIADTVRRKAQATAARPLSRRTVARQALYDDMRKDTDERQRDQRSVGLVRGDVAQLPGAGNRNGSGSAP